jgi:hypothetical protein
VAFDWEFVMTGVKNKESGLESNTEDDVHDIYNWSQKVMEHAEI